MFLVNMMAVKPLVTTVYNLLECKDVGIAFVVKKENNPEMTPKDSSIVDQIEFLYVSLMGDDMTIPTSDGKRDFGLLAVRKGDLDQQKWDNGIQDYKTIINGKGNGIKTFALFGFGYKPTDFTMLNDKDFFYWNISGASAVTEKGVMVGNSLFNDQFDDEVVPSFSTPGFDDALTCQFLVWNVDRTRTTLNCKDIGYLEEQNYLAQGPAELVSGAYIVQACKQGMWVTKIDDYVKFMSRENLDKYALGSNIVRKILAGFAYLPQVLPNLAP